MKKTQPKQAFTLIELLTVIAIIGILASILIPTVGRVREAARRSVDASNIRQIGQAALIYANDNREALPPRNLNNTTGLPTPGADNTTDVFGFAAALAVGGGINDGSVWLSASDTNRNVYNGSPILTATGNPRTVRNNAGDFGQQDAISFGVVSGLRSGNASTAPIAFTRGLLPNGEWQNDRIRSVYGADGGHIVFIGGNVSFYKHVKGDDGLGALVNSNGTRTANIRDTIPADQGRFSTKSTQATALNNQMSTGG